MRRLAAVALLAAATGFAQSPGDPVRGKQVVVSRDLGNCLLCHAIPDSPEPFAGNIGPPLAGAGARLSVAELRQRIADSSAVNPDTLMPPYFRTENLHAVAPQFRGKPVLTAQQVEDVVAYLATLK